MYETAGRIRHSEEIRRIFEVGFEQLQKNMIGILKIRRKRELKNGEYKAICVN